jgi:DNA-directed RNA polymerase specialized sigma24 family protein
VIWRKYILLVQKQKGYTTIRLDYKIYSLHRIVAKSFINNPDNKPEVNHKDGNKKNNCSDNLEWVSHYENLRHAFDTGLLFRLSDDKRNEVRDLHKTGNYSYRKLASMFNVSLATIQSILKF